MGFDTSSKREQQQDARIAAAEMEPRMTHGVGKSKSHDDVVTGMAFFESWYTSANRNKRTQARK